MEDDLFIANKCSPAQQRHPPPQTIQGFNLEAHCMSCDPASIQHNCCVRPTGRLQGSHGNLDTPNIASQWVHCLVFKQLCGTCCLITCAAPGSQVQVLVAATQGVHSSLAAAAAGGGRLCLDGEQYGSCTQQHRWHQHGSRTVLHVAAAYTHEFGCTGGLAL